MDARRGRITLFGKVGYFSAMFSSVRNCFSSCFGSNSDTENQCDQSTCWLHQSCRPKPILCDFELNPCYDHFGLEIRVTSAFPQDYKMEPVSILPHAAERKSEMPSVYDCPVCFCEYTIDGNQTPCVLPCGHSVCLECSFKLCGQSRSGRKASKCPFCRQNLPLQRSSSFSINYALLSVLEHQQRAEAAKESSRRRCSEIHVTFDDNPPEEMYSSNHPSSAKRPSAQSDSIIEYSSRTACRCKPGNEREAYQRASVKPIKASHEIQKSRGQLPPIPPHEPLDERFIQAGESIPSQRQKLRRTHDS